MKEHNSLPAPMALTSFMDAMSDEVAVLDRDGFIVATNSTWNNFCRENEGDTRHFYRGTNYLDTCRGLVGGSGAEAAIIPEAFEKVLQTGETFQCEYPCNSPSVVRWFELTANRMILDGETYLLVQHRNITTRHLEREAVEQACITANAMAALIATTSDAILSYDLEGRVIIWNPAAETLYGYSADEIVGRTLETLYPPDWPRRISYYRDEIIAGRLAEFEATRVAKDGTRRDVWISCAPIRSATGEIIAISNIHRDVTESRKAEQARDLIAHEVIHRAKNMLGIVTSILRQTARVETTQEGFMKSFEGRIGSLSESTDLLVKSAWSSIDLTELVQRHLGPFVSPEGSGVTIAGPDVTLKPQCVQTIGMAVHELATNSAKYGVLGPEDGLIEIAWRIEPAGAAPVLHLSWRETSPTSQWRPQRQGFGNTVLTKLAPSLLDAETDYCIDPGKVAWTITVSSEHFDRRAGQKSETRCLEP